MNTQGKCDASYSWLGARGVELRINLKIEKNQFLYQQWHFGKFVLLAVYRNSIVWDRTSSIYAKTLSMQIKRLTIRAVTGTDIIHLKYASQFTCMLPGFDCLVCWPSRSIEDMVFLL